MISPFIQTIDNNDKLITTRILQCTDWVENICHEIISKLVVWAIECPCSVGNASDGSQMHRAELSGDHLNDPLRGLCSQIDEKYTPNKAVL